MNLESRPGKKPEVKKEPKDKGAKGKDQLGRVPSQDLGGSTGRHSNGDRPQKG